MLIRIETGDWLKNASIVGFYKVLLRLKQNVDSIIIKKNCIEFDSTLLENFTEAYFETIADEYKDELTYFKIMNKNVDNINNIKELNEFVEYTKNKLLSNSYKSAYQLAGRNELIDSFKKLQKVKIKNTSTEEEINKILEDSKTKLKNIQNTLSDKTLKKYIVAKNCMYQIIGNFFENKSFMLTSKSSSDMYTLYHNDFVLKALAYENSDKSKFKYRCSCCDKPIKKLETSFSWLCKQGVDVSRKTSHFWDGVVDLYMCDTCALVYSCACLGFNKRFNKAIFVNNNRSVEDLIQTNLIKVIDEDKNINNINALTYFSLLNYMTLKEIDFLKYDMDNIQVVQMDTEKNNVFEFSMMTKELLRLIYYNRHNLKKISSSFVKVSNKYTLQVFDEVINRLYLNKSLYDLISELFSYYYDDAKKVSIKTIEIIQRIEGGKRMKESDLKLAKMLGQNLKSELIEKKLDGKLATLNYKLINALRTNNADRFLDTLLDIHMYLKKDVPSELLKIKLGNDKFYDFGYAYLIGLNSEVVKKESDDDKLDTVKQDLKEELINEK